MDHERKTWFRIRWPVAVIGALGLLAFLYAVFGGVGVISTLNLRAKENQLIEENSKLREENALLRKEVEQLRSNPSYIEEIARRELGLMGKKEIVIPLDRKKNAGSPPSPSRVEGRP